ncbi:MAG TPA: AMP-binding protein, partial [Polyangia bacterium]|nr:AMP-binding protein [Polyangia bacterium]
MVQAFELTSVALGDRVAIRTKGDEQTLTWAQWHQRARDLAGGLRRLGLRRGETLALLLGNRPEFHVADIAAVTLGATPFSIYQTYAANQIEFVVSDADARIAIVERQYLDRLLEAQRNLSRLEYVILVDPGKEALPEGVLTLADVEASGRGEETQREVQDAAA